MTYDLGADCDVVLIHPSINSGDPYGFVLTPDPQHKTSAVSVQREITSEGVIYIYIFFTVILADSLKNPDGSEHTDSRETMYLKLLEYLSYNSGLSVSTVMGTWLGIGPLGHAATEMHMPNGSYVSVKLGNVSTYHPPVSSVLFLGSKWQGSPADADALTWGTSLWR